LSGFTLYLQPVQDLTMENRGSRTQYQFTLETPDAEELNRWTLRLVEQLTGQPEFSDVTSDVQDQGQQVYVNIDPNTASRLAITTAAVDNTLYSDYGQRLISTIFTQSNQYRVVLEVDPAAQNSPETLNALSKYGVGLEDVRNTITQTNVTRPKDVLENGGQRWQIQANDQACKAQDYMPLIVSYRNGAPVTIADLGEVVDSVEDLRNTGLKNGKPSVLLIIRKQPLANVIQTVDQVLAMMPQLRANIPNTIDLSVVVDRSLTIRASIIEVEHSLLIAIGLVILVVLVFLRNLRSTLIPVIVVLVSLIGACAVMYFYRYY